MMQESRLDSYLFGGNAPYVEELYESYLNNPGSVAEHWREYFDRWQHVPAPDGSNAIDVAHGPIVKSFAQRSKDRRLTPQNAASDDLATKQVYVQQLIAAYRFLGAQWANLDPLKRQERPQIPELEPAFYDFTEADMGPGVRRHEPVLRLRESIAARDRQGIARDVLRLDRRRVHVHQRSGTEALDGRSGSNRSAPRRISRPKRKSTSSIA